jgi:hypothetical protein
MYSLISKHIWCHKTLDFYRGLALRDILLHVHFNRCKREYMHIFYYEVVLTLTLTLFHPMHQPLAEMYVFYPEAWLRDKAC